MTKVACLQMWLDEDQTREQRIEHAEAMIDQASDADLIVLPELWNIGWYAFDRYKEMSETLEGETISRIAEKAKQVDAYIMAGTIVEKKEDKLFNTAVLLDPKGKVVADYGKMHIPSMAGPEKQYITRNENIVTVKTNIGTIGFGICYDLRFPELYRKMAVNHGVEIFIQPAAWPLVRVENWMDLLHARATENQCYMVACNCAGVDHGKQYLGHSTIVDPYGMSISLAGLFESIVRAEIDLDIMYKLRETQTCFEDRILST
ncbi:MAG: carbon-nitrogen family hydrolase [Desulfobacteraceae bacterium]|nr:carbon-nitrogen family hydrolase [Desulfobacteraceae bacterium]